ncbi:biotin transporter BioY [Barrientosiimonas marina]|uniref:Biotin transporter n=1 Tax=Lentibacillus kimchii TaxID=1542911 RepID=A0ABW2UTZ8_9BACI
MGNTKLQMMIVTALFTAIIGILAQVAIPLPLVPITGQTLAIGLAATILGSRYGTYSTILYMIIGAIGVPVFSQMTSGLGILLGPTGGFIVGFIPTVYFMGKYLEMTRFNVTHAIIANVMGMFITLIFGTVWLKIVASLTWYEAFLSGFAPFVAVGLIKAVLAGWIGIVVRRRLKEAHILVPAA